MFTFLSSESDNATAVADQLASVSDGMEKVTRDALSDTLLHTRARTEREILTTIAISRSRWLNLIDVSPVRSESALQVSGILKIEDSKSIPLSAFEAKQTIQGVEVQLSRFSATKLVFEGAFGPEIPALGRNIYRRAGKARFPIEKIRDLTVKQVPETKDAFDKTTAGAKDLLLEGINRGMEALLK
jgi:hypothetical protein